MVKSIWPCAESEIRKGRWKVSRCSNEDIKLNAERIFLEVFGHPLHNADSPLYFAKMLYVQFVQGRPVDFTSKDITVSTHDLREETVTFTREELALMVEEAGLELSKIKETLGAQIVEKEQEVVRLSQAQTPPPSNAKVETQLNKLSQDVHDISQRLNPVRQGNHITHFLMHPELIGVNNVATSSTAAQCPVCYKIFDGWSGHYLLGCGHFYHLICLVRHMQSASTCILCGVDINQGMYAMLGMATEYKPSGQPGETPSAIQNLFRGEN